MNKVVQDWGEVQLAVGPSGIPPPPLGWTMRGFPAYSIIAAAGNAFPAITGLHHTYYNIRSLFFGTPG